MELVKGVPINGYCDKNQLSLKERLELFIPVGQAIQHAHQKGVIHRDLKPANVMVTTLDKVYNWSRKSSMWPLLFGLACCAIVGRRIGVPLPECCGERVRNHANNVNN